MMSSDEEHLDGSQDEQDMDEDGTPRGRETMSLTNFLFGNVDEKGELENDFLDEVSRG